jgi:HK97 family phage prohead protease
MERRFVSVAAQEVRLEERAGKQPKIVGYASVFYQPGQLGTEYMLYDDMVERIMPGCFDRAIKEDDCRALFNHDPNCLLGRMKPGTLTLKTDSTGLRYEIDPPDTQAGRDTIESIRRGDLTGSSFSFAAQKTLWREENKVTIRELHGVQLFDVGPVTFPAYGAATAGLRALSEPGEALKEYEAWRSNAGGRGQDALRARARLAEIEAGLAPEPRFTHNSKTADKEPSWGSVDKSKLPRLAFADKGEADKKSTWGYPHHWVSGGGEPNDNGVYTAGTLYLHEGGLNAAWAAAQGAHTGKKAGDAVIAHLRAHRKALGLEED